MGRLTLNVLLSFAQFEREVIGCRQRHCLPAWEPDLILSVAQCDAALRRVGASDRLRPYLAPLAFVSPRIVEAIVNGRAPADLTVSSLARTLPHNWTAQEHKLGII